MSRVIWPRKPLLREQKIFESSRAGRKITDGAARLIESVSPFTKSFSSQVAINQYGQKEYANMSAGALPVNKSIIQGTEVRYPSKDHNDNGFFNGFPFLLQEENEYIKPIENKFKVNDQESVFTSNFCERGLTGVPVSNYDSVNVLGGGYELYKTDGYYSPCDNFNSRKSVTCNNFWNLAAVETDFVIQTRSCPDFYETGYCFHTSKDYDDLQLISEDYEVVESFSDNPYLPHLRKYIDPTGSIQQCSINEESRLIEGSGQNYSSMFVHGHDTGNFADFFMPLSIQPSNTGAFTITFDKGVANYLENLDSFGEKKSFNCNMLFDFNIKDRDHEGFVGSNSEYHCFPYKGYIIPAKGWDFTVLGSKVKGIYYTYAQNADLRYAGDQTSNINHRPWYKEITFCYSKNSPARFGGHDIIYNDSPYTHIPFEYAAGKVEDGKDVYYSYYFAADSRFSYVTPIIDLDENSEYRPEYQYGLNFSSLIGSQKPEIQYFHKTDRDTLVLSDDMIHKFFNEKYRYTQIRTVGRNSLKAEDISSLFRNSLLDPNRRYSNEGNSLHLENKSRTIIDSEVTSRFIGRKKSDYSQYTAPAERANLRFNQKQINQGEFPDFRMPVAIPVRRVRSTIA